MAGRARDPSPEACIDLHGCTRQEALRRLGWELHACRVRRCSELLVITGAGHSSRSGEPVLRDAVEGFLRSRSARRLGVSSFHRTHRAGALVVRLTVP